jgi:hypothetical protein
MLARVPRLAKALFTKPLPVYGELSLNRPPEGRAHWDIERELCPSKLKSEDRQ